MKSILAFIFLQVAAATQPYGFYGPYQPGPFWSAIAHASLAFILVTFVDVASRDVHKPGTPTVFSWATLANCNWKRGLRNIILIYLGIRFCPEISGWKFGDWSAVLLGASVDSIFVFIKKARYGSKRK